MVRLVLISASPLLRAGLRAGLERAGIEVVHEADSLAAAREGVADADVLVVDPEGEPESDELDGWIRLGPRIVLLVGADTSHAADWLSEGVSVVPSSASFVTMAAALHAAAAGLVAAPPALWRSALRTATGERAAADIDEPMTPREREVLEHMARGLANREIAEKLHISPHTAKFHVAQVIAKLDARSRAHAVARAVGAGLVSEEV